MSDLVLVKKEAGIATLVINNPKSGNALDYDTFVALEAAVAACEEDSEVRVLVITGAGKHFSTGGNIKDFWGRIETETFITSEEAKMAASIGKKLRNCKKPTIAMVNHAAAGAGFSLACACDFRIVEPSTQFVMAFINMALPGDTDGLYFLGKLIGISRTTEIMMTGRPVGGEEAYQIGLATQLAKEGELEEVTYKLAKKLAAGPALALTRQKELINKYFYNDRLEEFGVDEAAYTQECSKSDDFKEAVQSFLEKRRPVFQGK